MDLSDCPAIDPAAIRRIELGERGLAGWLASVLLTNFTARSPSLTR